MDNLKHLIGAYFYELWDQYEYSSWEDAVDDFAKRSPSRVAGAHAEIDGLLRAVDDDRELASTLAQWGLAYSPPEGDRAWLAAMRDRMTAALPQ